MSRQPGYKQVSLTAEAHRALQQMSYITAANIAERVTLSQTILIAQKLLDQQSTKAVIVAASAVGIEPPIETA